MTVLDSAFDGTDLAIEAVHLDADEPYHQCKIAGLQFYEYGRSDGVYGKVMPKVGQRLQLVRCPHNLEDANAIEVWLGNGHHIGHLPREVAKCLAPALDDGESVRCYCTHPGNGRNWSASIVLVGKALLRGFQIDEEAA